MKSTAEEWMNSEAGMPSPHMHTMTAAEMAVHSQTVSPPLGTGARERPVPSIGRIVHYVLNQLDCAEIDMLREAFGWRGNPVSRGMVLPMQIVTVHGQGPDAFVNGKVELDGIGQYWKTSVQAVQPGMPSAQPGFYFWPPRV